MVGDAGCHLGDAGEIADGIVTGGDFGVTEMKHVKVLGASRPLGLGVHASQEIGVPLRIENNYHIATADILGDEYLGKPCLAHARRAQHQCMTDPLTDIHPDILLVGFHRMQRRFSTYRRKRCQWIPPCPCAKKSGQQAQ